MFSSCPDVLWLVVTSCLLEFMIPTCFVTSVKKDTELTKFHVLKPCLIVWFLWELFSPRFLLHFCHADNLSKFPLSYLWLDIKLFFLAFVALRLCLVLFRHFLSLSSPVATSSGLSLHDGTVLGDSHGLLLSFLFVFQEHVPLLKFLQVLIRSWWNQTTDGRFPWCRPTPSESIWVTWRWPLMMLETWWIPQETQSCWTAASRRVKRTK